METFWGKGNIPDRYLLYTGVVGDCQTWNDPLSICTFHCMKVYLKRKKKHKIILSSNFMPLKIFRRKCTDVCNLTSNASKIIWINEWIDG